MRTSTTQPQLGTQINKSHPLAQGLVGCWLMNDGGGQIVVDGNQSNRINGSLKNGAFFKQSQVGNCVVLDGTDDYVDLTSLFPFNEAVTASVWVNFNSLTPAYTSVLAKIKIGGLAAHYQILVKSTGKMALYVFAGNQRAIDPGNITLVVGKWYNLVLTYSAVSGLTGYVNGMFDANQVANGALAIQSPSTLTIGTDIQTAGRYVNGFLGNVQIWRRALSASEVKQLYTNPYQMFQQARLKIAV